MPRAQRDSKRKSNSAASSRPPVPKRADRHAAGKPVRKAIPAESAAAPTLDSLLAETIRSHTFLKLVLSNPLVKTGAAISKVTVREIQLKGGSQFQWTIRNQSQERHENLSRGELVERVRAEFGTKFADAHLFSSAADLTIRWTQGQPQKIKRKPPSGQLAIATDHNLQKNYLIPAGVPCPFLTEIGVMLADGQVRPSMYHKFRQINRYLEFVEDLMSHLPSTGRLNVVDFGCGKSYLTFALHHLLTKIHGREVSIVGLDLKQSVMEDCQRIAQALCCAGLHFEVGRIESFEPTSHVHLAVSLHACDTATDDALAAAIRWQCEAIMAVPCCQHEVCQAMSDQTLPGLTRFGILKERFASLATDSLRALLLDLNGYRTQVLEFIETEHTPKNLLMRSLRRPEEATTELAQRREEYDQLKRTLGLTDWHLELAIQRNGKPK